MDYYENALDNYDTAEVLVAANKYRASIYHSCLAIELLLKSKLCVVGNDFELEKSHDIIGLYIKLRGKYRSSKNLIKEMRFCRKYFNESRYPSFSNVDEIYTKEFAEQFLSYVKDIKEYIYNDCQASLNDLENKFTKVRKLDSFDDK